MKSAYTEAIHAIENPQELVSSGEFRQMMLAILSAPMDFATDDAAEDYVKLNEYGVARVIERGVHVETFWGKKYK